MNDYWIAAVRGSLSIRHRAFSTAQKTAVFMEMNTAVGGKG